MSEDKNNEASGVLTVIAVIIGFYLLFAFTKAFVRHDIKNGLLFVGVLIISGAIIAAATKSKK